MVPIENALKDLSVLGKKLKSETDALNEVITNLNRRLAETEIGISTWTALLDDRERTAITADEIQLRLRSGWQLGYCKVGDAWTIAVKQVEWQLDDSGNFDHDVYEKDPISLLKAPRHIRVEPAAHLEDLVESLSRKAKEFIANIEKAKKLT
jgi:hypothetical protein